MDRPTVTPWSLISWSVPVTEIKGWPVEAPIEAYQVWWENSESIAVSDWHYDSLLRANVQDAIIAPQTSTPIPMTPTSVGVESISASGHQNFAIACTAQGLRLYRNSDLSLISQTPLHLAYNDCDSIFIPLIVWSPDETAAAFIASEGDVYVWETSGAPPLKVGVTDSNKAELASWSPTSQEFLVVNALPDSADNLTFFIAYRDGRPARTTEALLRTRSESEPFWISERIIEHESQCGASCSFYTFYDAFTGRDLVSYTSDYGGVLSPNHRWLVATQYDGDQLSYDFQRQVGHALDNDPTHAFQYLDWSADSSKFYLINRPPYEGIPTLPDINSPGELVAFDPVTRKLRTLLSNVLYVDLNDQRDAFLVITTSSPENPELMVALYDLQGQPLTPLWPLGESLKVEADLFDPALVSSWSPSGAFVIFTGRQGNIRLLDRQGELHTLAKPVSVNPGLKHPSIIWSPDDKYALIILETQAWFMPISQIEAP